MRSRHQQAIVVLSCSSLLLAACGSTKIHSKTSHPVDRAAESPAQLAKLPKSFPVAIVPLPKGAPLVDVANDSTKRRLQFQLTFAPSPAQQATYMENFVHVLEGLGFVLRQHSYANTPSALYSLDDTRWEVLVEGSSSTVGVSVVARR